MGQKEEELHKEILRLNSLLYANEFFHYRLWLLASGELNPKREKKIKIMRGLRTWRKNYLHREDVSTALGVWHNIPKLDRPIIIRSLEILGLITKDGEYYKIKKPRRSRERTILNYKNNLGLNSF